MSVTSHLKDLLTKMGGTPKNGDSTSVLIDKIEDVYDGSGSGGGGSISDLPLVVTIYADDLLPDPDNSGKAFAVLKMNKTYSEMLNACEAGRSVDFIFETRKMNPAGGQGGQFDVDLILVLHNDHSGMNVGNIILNGLEEFDNFGFITEEEYSAHFIPGEYEFILIGRQLGAASMLVLRADQSAYSVHINANSANGATFDETFTCQSVNDYPSLNVSVRTK